MSSLLSSKPALESHFQPFGIIDKLFLDDDGRLAAGVRIPGRDMPLFTPMPPLRQQKADDDTSRRLY